VQAYRLGIQGVSPLLMNRFGEHAEGSVGADTRRIKVQKASPRDQAEEAAYRLPDGRLYLPSAALHRSIVEAAGEFKQRGMRKSLKYVVPAAILFAETSLTFDPEIKDFEVDARPVVIPATKGRVMRYRPRIEEWRLECDLFIDDEIIDAATLHEIIGVAGRRKGVGDYRPEKMGPYGRFIIVDWSLLTHAGTPGSRRTIA